MHLVSILKLRFESDRYAAIALDKAVKGVGVSSMGTLHDVDSGVERLSWYSSCFFDKYADVCSDLKDEDIRFLKAIGEIYKRRDVIEEMIKMYLEEEMKDFNNSKIQSIDKKLAETLSSRGAGTLTKAALAGVISTAVVNSLNFKRDVIIKINKFTPVFITALSMYGKVQEAAQAARRLKQLSPGLYQVLYQNNMEMLYFLISDKIDKALVNSLGLPEEDRFIAVVKSLSE